MLIRYLRFVNTYAFRLFVTVQAARLNWYVLG